MAGYIQYANQGATRKRPLSERLTGALSFLPELGVTMEVFSGGQGSADDGGERVGSTRHDHGEAADVFFYKDGKRLDWSNPDDVPLFQNIVSRGRSAGISGFGAGDNYMQPGSMHLGFGTPAVWGADGKSANAPKWLKAAFDGTPQGTAPGGSDTPATAAPQALQDAYDAGRLTPDQRTRFESRFMPAPAVGGGTVAPEVAPEVAPTPQEAAPIPTAQFIPLSVAEAYSSGNLDAGKRAQIDTLVASGAVSMPDQTMIDNWAMTPRGVDPEGTQAPVATAGTFDRTRDLGGDMAGAAGAYAAGATGFGPSVTAQQLPDGMPEIAKRVIGGGADLGMAALTGAAALTYGAAGLAGDVADATGIMAPNTADRFSNDLAAMPDAFAGSPGGMVRPGANMPRPARPVVRPAAAARRAPAAGTPEFADWFAGSKTADPSGNPTTMYHGTQAGFDSFEGISWFSSDKNLARDYSENLFNPDGKASGSPRVVEAAVSIKAPFDADLGLGKKVSFREFINSAAQQADDLGLDPDVAKISQLLDSAEANLGADILSNSIEKQEFWNGQFAGYTSDILKASGFDGIKVLESPQAAFSGQRAAPVQTFAALSPEQVSLTGPRSAGPGAAASALPNDPTAVGRLVSDASAKPRPNTSQRRLAAGMDIDPEAQAAADSLKFDLPPDVLSRNEQIKAAAGLTRSVAGSPVEATWRNTIAAASDRALEVMAEIKSTNLAEISERVKSSLQTTRADLEAQAKPIFDAISAQVGPRTMIEPNNMVRTVNEIVGDLGGEAGMSPAEKNLFNLVTSNQPITYERLSREMRDVGKAIGKQDGPYKDVDSSYLKRVYGAMAEDRLANVERVAGTEARANLEIANGLHAQKKDLEDTIVSAFGRDGEGSIASKLITAVNGGAKRGDISGLNRILNAIPSDLQGEALASAIGHVASSTGSTATPFNFAAYSSLYKGMRDNPAVYSRVIGTLGEEADGILRGLYVVSDRVTKARANVLTTGKSNQALVQGMTPERIVDRIMGSSIGRRATQGAATMAGATVGGAPGAVAGNAIAEALARGGRNHIDQAGRMFSSPEFQRLVTEAATQATPSRQAINGVTNSAAYRRWARATGIKNPDQWLTQAVILSTQATTAQGNQQ
tara:strand:+ start:11488 stop:14889 length:3402 start_codon:yes stop_codon:yes gene_type:complete